MLDEMLNDLRNRQQARKEEWTPETTRQHLMWEICSCAELTGEGLKAAAIETFAVEYANSPEFHGTVNTFVNHIMRLYPQPDRAPTATDAPGREAVMD